MVSVFTRIIAGELPGRFVWKDEHAVAFLSIAPIRPGHVLVVPRQEVDHWIDLSDELAAHLMLVSRKIGAALQAAFKPTKVGMMVVGLEVLHVHLHLMPIDGLDDMNFANADPNPEPAALDRAANSLRAALTANGHAEVAE
jgi:histidine triad (HIT) family protein